MSKKGWVIVAIVVLLLLGVIGFLTFGLHKQMQENQAMQELAELDKQEMENEYMQYANQYSEMKAQISNDSIIAQLTIEQEKTQKLLEELRRVKSNDAREITRLKKELATLRAVLRSYVLEIDSLNRLNQNLIDENTRVKGQYNAATKQIEGLSSEKATLTEKVAIAAQLDATGISMTLKNKRGKTTNSIKKCKTIQLGFTVTKNVTAANGIKTFYIRVTTPTGSLLGDGDSFEYENRTLKSTLSKSVEYGGQELSLNLYWNVSQTLMEGTYNVSIFADGNMIGTRSFTFK